MEAPIGEDDTFSIEEILCMVQMGDSRRSDLTLVSGDSPWTSNWTPAILTSKFWNYSMLANYLVT